MDNFFYQSNPRLGHNEDLNTERQRLAEEQKKCRTRARQFSMETNHRRKELDERRKQREMQEQQLRENILAQRRQQLQDVTQRFQRAHLPPSQRHRPSFRRNVPNLDDALKQIQCTSRPYSQQKSFTVNTVNRTSSPKPPTVSKSSHRTDPSAVEADTELLQDQSRTEKQQDHNPQGGRMLECCISESLSSKDSLDNEDVKHGTRNPQGSFSSFFLNSDKTHPDQRKDKNFELALKKQDNSDWPRDKRHISQAFWEFTSVQKTAEADTRPTLHNCNKLALCEQMSDDREHFKEDSFQSSPREHISTSGGPAENIGNIESAYPLLDIKEQKNYNVKLLKYPSATKIPLPAKDGDSKDVLLGSPSKPNIFLNDSPTDNLVKEETPQQTTQESYYLSSQKEPSAFINNLNKGSNTNHKDEKSLNTASLQHARLSNIQSGTYIKYQEHFKEEIQKVPVSETASRSVSNVRFIKGILKKQSKYISREPTYAYSTGHSMFPDEVALAIKDSIDFAKAKAKDRDGNNTVKTKVRWFDEVNVEKEPKEQNMIKHAKGMSFNPPQCKNNSKDHQPSLAASSGTPRSGPSVTPAHYHFTKQAWADVGVQVSLPQERSEEVKAPQSNTSTGSPRVPRRELSARAAAGPVSLRTRKGTIMRPQTATEVNQIAKAPGRMIAPRPPPRVESVAETTTNFSNTPYALDLSGFHCKQVPAFEQMLSRGNSDVFLSPTTHHAITMNNNATYAPLPPSYIPLFSEGSSKRMSGHQEAHIHSRRRGTVPSEKALCLRCTPTDEEISQIWHGVRNALTTKDAKTALRRQAPENGRVLRKPSIQPPSSGNRRLLPTSQTTQLARPFPNSSCAAFPNRGSERTTQFHLAQGHTQGLLEEERDMVAAMETAQTQKPSQQQGLTNISLEEQKILQSLERLNHHLQCEHSGQTVYTQSL